MDVRHIILGRPWLYDMDVIVYGRSKTYSFDFKDKRIKLVSRPPKVELEVLTKVKKSKSVKETKTKDLHIIGSKEFGQEIKEETVLFSLVTQEASPNSQVEHHPEVTSILREFQDMFPKNLLDEFPPM